MKEVIGVNFNDSNKIYYFSLGILDVSKNDFVVVSTERGEQVAKVVTDKIIVDESKLDSPLKDVIRVADFNDIKINDNNISDAEKAVVSAKKIVSDLGLDMQILGAYYTFNRKQLVFNFLADSRVDFRELAKKLASIYKTRIELRQIGIRDKAKIVGGYGQCGKKLCCGAFLNDINSVSINMAKNQNLALNPQKINGVCGRLMCCLAYENDNYSEYKKGLPKVGQKIEVNSEMCRVISVDIFSRTYKAETTDGKIIEVDLEV